MHENKYAMQITSGLGVLPQASFWPTDGVVPHVPPEVLELFQQLILASLHFFLLLLVPGLLLLLP